MFACIASYNVHVHCISKFTNEIEYSNIYNRGTETEVEVLTSRLNSMVGRTWSYVYNYVELFVNLKPQNFRLDNSHNV